MYARSWAQDVLRCRLCETLYPPMYCEVCNIHLCKACVGEHLSDESKDHKVVPFKKRGLNPKCAKHLTQLCDLYCEQCDIPYCLECVSSGEHVGHKQDLISKILKAKKEALQKDLQDLENVVYPKYQDIASNIPVQKADLKKHSKKLATAIRKHREDVHREIDIAIQKIKSDLNEMKSKHLVVLNNHEIEIKRIISEITHNIAKMKNLLHSNDFCLVSNYKSRKSEFSRMPPKLTVSLPRFTPQKIDKEEIIRQFGSLSTLSIKTNEHGFTINSTGAEFSHTDRAVIDESRIITSICTEYGGSNGLRSVSCLSDDEVWTRGQDNMMRLYNLNGELVKSIQTRSGETPYDIAVNQNGELVYTDYHAETVDVVNNTQIQTVIRLLGWKPFNVCSTSSGDLLVVVYNDNRKETKVVRYSGSTEKQSFQFNDNGKPLYSSELGPKYISENKNLDICVADNYARELVVVNQAGKLKFTYSGPPSTTPKPFLPTGISTDSLSQILAADYNNQNIHVLDQDGQFLGYINNFHLHHPFGLCMDTKDNLFVAEVYTGRVKKI
nr:uncharacterized protein LOC109619870 [Crassostrea gigas]